MQHGNMIMDYNIMHVAWKVEKIIDQLVMSCTDPSLYEHSLRM